MVPRTAFATPSRWAATVPVRRRVRTTGPPRSGWRRGHRVPPPLGGGLHRLRPPAHSVRRGRAGARLCPPEVTRSRSIEAEVVVPESRSLPRRRSGAAAKCTRVGQRPAPGELDQRDSGTHAAEVARRSAMYSSTPGCCRLSFATASRQLPSRWSTAASANRSRQRAGIRQRGARHASTSSRRSGPPNPGVPSSGGRRAAEVSVPRRSARICSAGQPVRPVAGVVDQEEPGEQGRHGTQVRLTRVRIEAAGVPGEAGPVEPVQRLGAQRQTQSGQPLQPASPAPLRRTGRAGVGSGTPTVMTRGALRPLPIPPPSGVDQPSAASQVRF